MIAQQVSNCPQGRWSQEEVQRVKRRYKESRGTGCSCGLAEPSRAPGSPMCPRQQGRAPHDTLSPEVLTATAPTRRTCLDYLNSHVVDGMALKPYLAHMLLQGHRPALLQVSRSQVSPYVKTPLAYQ